jgi:hypothetical protein
MPWEINDSSSTERLPIDSRFIAKMDRGITTRNEQANSKFIKRWRSADEYDRSVKLNTEEREVYNYVADLVASGLAVDPVSIEETLLNSSESPIFISKAANFYSQPTSIKKVGVLEDPVEAPVGSYVEGILARLKQKGLVRYA